MDPTCFDLRPSSGSLQLSLAKVALILRHSVKLRRYLLRGDVAACPSMACVRTAASVVFMYTYLCLYRMSQKEYARLRENVPYVKVYRYNPKHLYPKLNGYGDNGQRKVRSSCGSTYWTCSADALRVHQNAQSAKLNQYINTAGYSCAM